MTEATWVARNGASFGPYSIDQLRTWLADGTLSAFDQAYTETAGWTTVAHVAGLSADANTRPPSPPPMRAPAFAAEDAEDAIVRRIANYERLAAIIWAVIALLQIISVVAIIAGVWNAYAAYTRFQLVPHIEARSRHVPAAFESITGLVVIGLINVFVGGVVGVVGIVMDFIVRDLVLKHRHVFEREATEVNT